MIDCYCKVCGLFINIPDEYAGGSGACPRCKTQLRIPKPLSPDSPDYVAGQRYIAQPLSSVSLNDAPVAVTSDMGPSKKFKCSGCAQFFESLEIDGQAANACPACKNVGNIIGQPAEFPRSGQNIPANETPTEQKIGDEVKTKKDDTVDGYLVLQPIESAELDVVLEGIAVDDNGNDITTATSDDAQKQEDLPLREETPQPVPQAENSVSPQLERRVSHPLRSRNQPRPSQESGIQDIREGQWAYFLKGKVNGPIDTLAFREMLSRGDVSQSVLVWKTGMDNWQPADAFEELKVEVQNASPSAISFHDDASAMAMKMLATRLRLLLWLAVILWAIVILTFLTRKTLESLGIEAYFTSVIVLLSFSLAGLGMGAMLILKHSRSFIRSGGKAMAEWLVSMVAFCCAIAVSFSVYTRFEPAKIFENVEYYQGVAHEGFDYLYDGNFNATLNRVHWDEFIFNGRNVGMDFKRAANQKQRMLIIAEVMDQLREKINSAATSAPAKTPGTQPSSQPAVDNAPAATTQPSATIVQQTNQKTSGVYNWTVIQQTVGNTVVMGRSHNGRRINVTVRGGMITEITIR